MHQRGSSTSNAESRRRSGDKQSRTERRERNERRALLRGRSGGKGEHRFGILLQAAVAKQLGRLGVPHRLIDYRDDYARDERVELVMLDDDRDSAIAEIQYTLRRGVRGKIADFLRAATVRPAWDVPRFYVEIEDHVGLALKPMAERLAHAIRDIVDTMSEWTERSEQGNTVGLAVVFDHDRRTQIFPIRLLRVIGTRARNMLADLLESFAPPVEEPQVVAVQPAETVVEAPLKPRTRPVPFYQALIESVRDRFAGFAPHPAPAYVSRQTHNPRRMPFRR